MYPSLVKIGRGPLNVLVSSSPKEELVDREEWLDNFGDDWGEQSVTRC